MRPSFSTFEPGAQSERAEISTELGQPTTRQSAPPSPSSAPTQQFTMSPVADGLHGELPERGGGAGASNLSSRVASSGSSPPASIHRSPAPEVPSIKPVPATGAALSHQSMQELDVSQAAIKVKEDELRDAERTLELEEKSPKETEDFSRLWDQAIVDVDEAQSAIAKASDTLAGALDDRIGLNSLPAEGSRHSQQSPRSSHRSPRGPS